MINSKYLERFVSLYIRDKSVKKKQIRGLITFNTKRELGNDNCASCYLVVKCKKRELGNRKEGCIYTSTPAPKLGNWGMNREVQLQT